MRLLAICIAALLMFAAPAWAQGGAGDGGLAPSGMTCYMPYSASRDHVVTGCEIPGYRMNYDAAQAFGILMVLLPDGVASVQNTPLYFGVGTLPFKGRSLKGLLAADFRRLRAQRPGTRILKHLGHRLPMKAAGKGSGSCVGLALAYPDHAAYLPYETYFICKSASRRHALVLVLGAQSRERMDAAMPDFLKWMDVPQAVRDVTVRRVR